MRCLSKIVLLNAAQIRYAEVLLDGNTHFIGTQGAGKSTLLRAVLFFYNADPLGLGISREKKSYVDYYFPRSNSYVVYEVERDESRFCVVSYQSQRKVCFRFLDGPYRREFFVDESSGAVPDRWEDIARRLDAAGVFYSKRKIDEYREYRDILYGNHNALKGEWRRWSLLESRDYRHVPKTIQNVFLNSKMDAEFIKQTIIMSLDNNIIPIDLNKYARHLGDFETQIADIRIFLLPKTSAQAEFVARLYADIRHLEREKIRLAGELARAITDGEARVPIIESELLERLAAISTLEAKIVRARQLFEEKTGRLRAEINVLDSNLKRLAS
jgi:hypothetical protein